ncbi:MAG: J domain-containing protein [Methylobacter sp.]
MAKFKTHYDSLNVSRNAPASVIKAAYKVLCQNYHPDKYAGGHDEAIRIMKVINGAYAVLSDPAKRAEHDQWIQRQEREHEADKAQRIVNIISKTYADSTLTPAKNSSVNDSTKLDRFSEAMSSVFNKLRLTGISRANKLIWLGVPIAVVAVAVSVTMLYQSGLKTKAVAAASVDQEIEAKLKKAKQLLKQGQALKALPLYLQLAEQGSAEAQFQAGLIYANGQGVAKDDKQAVGWFAKAAGQGHREAQTKLGFMYAIGKGVEQNYTLAFYWCYKAAGQGDVIAQYNLGLMYAKGQGVVKDNSLAFSWYSKAAEQGDAHAQYNLGEMYEKGVGVAKDSNQAATLYRKAANQGLAEAIAALKLLER